MSAPAASRRIGFLDGLRGVAILLVAGFHAYARYPDLMPFGDRFAGHPIRLGGIGVQLFFLISGFVILMTLERCRSFGHFLVKRWLRLFPAMLIGSVLIFATAPLFPLRPAGMPHWIDLLPGLTFIDDRWLQAALGVPVQPIEGAFWSIFTEVRFYFLFGFLYFWRGERFAIAILPVLTIVALVVERMGPDAALAVKLLDGHSFVWFATGALFYRWHQSGDRRALYGAMLTGLLSAYSFNDNWHDHVIGILPVLLFGLSLRVPLVQWLLSLRPILWVGAISYPFYLIHESAMVSVTRSLGAWGPAVLLPLPGLALVAAVAWVIAGQAEPRLRAAIEHATGLRRAGERDMHGQPPLP